MGTASVHDTRHARAGWGAGLLYFAAVFALGFALGTVRTLFVADAPGAGRLGGVLLELPVMLAASWIVCAWIVRRCAVPPAVAPRVRMARSRSRC